MAADPSSHFRVCHSNAYSIGPHLADLRKTVLDSKAHVVGICESWLKSDRHSCTVSIPGYKLVRVDRIGAEQGSVAMYIHDSLQYFIVAQSPQPVVYSRKPGFLFVLIKSASIKILVRVVYSSPKVGYWSHVEEALLTCNIAQDYIVLMGDFNINWRMPSTPRNILESSLYSCGLERIPFHPTHHDGTEPSTIDYICVSDLKSVVRRLHRHEQQHIPHILKHDVLFAAIALEAPKHVPQPITCHSFRHFNAENFQCDLASINWQRVLDFTSVDDKVEFLSSNILRL